MSQRRYEMMNLLVCLGSVDLLAGLGLVGLLAGLESVEELWAVRLEEVAALQGNCTSVSFSLLG